MNSTLRPLTQQEMALFARLAEVLPSAEAAIVREQLAVATILTHDENSRFVLKGPVRALRFAQSQTMAGTYDDDDGWPIDIIVHAAYGLLDSVERYRTDAGRIQNPGVPDPAMVRLSPSKDQRASADRAADF